MPTFDFAWAKCHQHFEAIVPFGTKKFPACPACGSVKIEKLLSMPGIAFKGSGFYKTDSSAKTKSEGPKKAEGQEMKKKEKKETSAEETTREIPKKSVEVPAATGGEGEAL